MKELRKELLSNVRRMVVKLGSRLLVDSENGGVNVRTISRMMGSIAKLREKGVEVVVVTSGAVGSGMAQLGLKTKPEAMSDRQACAAVGQAQLMLAYENAAKRHGLRVGQILCSADDFRERVRYKNIKATVDSLLRMGAIPVINENDTVAFAEIKVGDNDKLSADVSQFLGAQLLAIFTDEEGLFDKNPKEHPDAQLLKLVPEVDASIEKLAAGKGSAISTGGMATKLAAAKQATLAGCAVVLACGFRELPHRIAEGKEAGTLFLPATSRKLKSRERWLGLVSTPKGRVFVDAGAETALRQKGRSLLPVGIVRVEGRFAAGDIVAICSADRRPVARGVASWSHDALRRVLGLKTPEVRAVLGPGRPDEFVHRNNMVLL